MSNIAVGHRSQSGRVVLGPGELTVDLSTIVLHDPHICCDRHDPTVSGHDTVPAVDLTKADGSTKRSFIKQS